MHAVDLAFQLLALLWFALVALVFSLKYRQYRQYRRSDAASRAWNPNAFALELSGRGLVTLAVAVKLIGYAVPHARHAIEWLWVPILVAGLIRSLKSRRRRAAESAYTRSLRPWTRKR